MQDLLAQITRRIEKAAKVAFDPEEAIDSDGYDQAEREGLLCALEIVQDEFAKAERRAKRKEGHR